MSGFWGFANGLAGRCPFGVVHRAGRICFTVPITIRCDSAVEIVVLGYAATFAIKLNGALGLGVAVGPETDGRLMGTLLSVGTGVIRGRWIVGAMVGWRGGVGSGTLPFGNMGVAETCIAARVSG